MKHAKLKKFICKKFVFGCSDYINTQKVIDNLTFVVKPYKLPKKILHSGKYFQLALKPQYTLNAVHAPKNNF